MSGWIGHLLALEAFVEAGPGQILCDEPGAVPWISPGLARRVCPDAAGILYPAGPRGWLEDHPLTVALGAQKGLVLSTKPDVRADLVLADSLTLPGFEPLLPALWIEAGKSDLHQKLQGLLQTFLAGEADVFDHLSDRLRAQGWEGRLRFLPDGGAALAFGPPGLLRGNRAALYRAAMTGRVRSPCQIALPALTRPARWELIIRHATPASARDGVAVGPLKQVRASDRDGLEERVLVEAAGACRLTLDARDAALSEAWLTLPAPFPDLIPEAVDPLDRYAPRSPTS